MTFLDLCRQMRQECGIAGTGPLTTQGQTGEMGRVVAWVRQAWIEIQNEQHWRFDWARGSVTLDDTLTEYALPDDFEEWVPDTVMVGNHRLKITRWDEFRTVSDDTLRAAAIAPDGKLHLNTTPPANSTLTFEYWRTPQALDADSDTPRLPERYHMAIVYRAMLQYAMYENAQEVAQQAQMNSQRMMQQVANSELPNVSLGEALA